MNVNIYNTRDYERKRDWTLGENKPNSNPIKPNFQKAKMDVNLYVIEDYRKKDDFAVRKNKPKTNPICQKGKIDAKCVFTKDYEEKGGRVVSGHVLFAKPYDIKELVTAIKKLL